MAKTLYSLMLSDEVVAELDRAALKAGTNRSQMANRILAEHLSLLTPERRIEEIFRSVDRFFNEGAEMIPRFVPHQPTMQLKTALTYRYRPTLRYELRLYPEAENGMIGEINMVLRTQAEELLERMEGFAELWVEAESEILRISGPLPVYRLQPGRFSRTIRLLRPGMEADDFSEALSRYVQLLDAAFKAYLCGEADREDLEEMIREYQKGDTV